MPRRKKTISSPKAVSTAAKANNPAEKSRTAGFRFRHNQITKETFTAVAGLLSLFVVSLIFIAAFSLAAINAFKYLFGGPYCCQSGSAPLTESIIYGIDKKIYALDEQMRIRIVNNSNKPIYLAPCQYFNEFQKKIGDKWQTVSIAPCDLRQNQTLVEGEFEKVPEKVEEKISTSILGAGIWRGVSNVYFDCLRASAETCGNKRIIYSKEFRIENNQNGTSYYNSGKPQF